MHLLTIGVNSCLVARLKAQRTCLSPQAWAYGRDSVVEGSLIEERPELRLVAYGESIYTLPAFEYATQLYDTRVECMFTFSELETARRYIPLWCSTNRERNPAVRH